MCITTYARISTACCAPDLTTDPHPSIAGERKEMTILHLHKARRHLPEDWESVTARRQEQRDLLRVERSTTPLIWVVVLLCISVAGRAVGVW